MLVLSVLYVQYILVLQYNFSIHLSDNETFLCTVCTGIFGPKREQNVPPTEHIKLMVDGLSMDLAVPALR